MENSFKKLTIGMVIYDDWDGFYFSIQAIRMYHKEILNDVEFIVIDNNPTSKQGQEVKKFITSGWISEPIQYFEDDNSMGTATRTKIFDYARTPYVLVMDSHVLFESGGIKKLLDFFERGDDEGNLIQAPLLYDNMTIGATNFRPEWRDGMYGVWEINHEKRNEPFFEIDGQGLGVFACRKECWLGFDKKHKGFGGEEIIISDKFRTHGKKTICFTPLKWLHRFSRPNGVPYPNKYEDRVKNYFNSFLELNKPIFEIIEHFKTVGIKEETLRKWLSDVTNNHG